METVDPPGHAEAVRSLTVRSRKGAGPQEQDDLEGLCTGIHGAVSLPSDGLLNGEVSPRSRMTLTA